jgi:hypothetical protein
MTRSARVAALFALGLTAGVACAQTTYRCTLPDGRTVYQDSRCEDESKAKIIKPPSSAGAAGTSGPSASNPCPKDGFLPPWEVDPATGLESAARRKSRLEIEMATEIHSMYQNCSTVPGFKERFSRALADFRRNNPEVISRYESNAAAKGFVDCSVRLEAQRSRQYDASAVAEKTASCMKMIGPAMESVAREGILK